MPATQRNGRRLLGGAAKRIREAKQLSQDAVATGAGINFAYLSKIERNIQQPSVEVMCRLANALGVDLDDISYMTTIYVVPDEHEQGAA